MKSFWFWHKWLFATGLLVTIFGLGLTFFNQGAFFDFLLNRQINPVFFPDGQVSPEIVRFQQWIYAVLGATISGWGISIIFLTYYPFRSQDRWAWNAIALGVTVWYILDTTLSLYFRVVFNAAFNSILFIALWLPLVLTRKHFISKPDSNNRDIKENGA